MAEDRGVDRGAVTARDAGLRRVSRLTRWLLAGALALTAAFSAIAAHAFPGHSTSQASSTTQSGSGGGGSGTSQSGQTDDSSGSGLQSSSSSPSASSGSGSVTSGGS
jgi:hypothetical protein